MLPREDQPAAKIRRNRPAVSLALPSPSPSPTSRSLEEHPTGICQGWAAAVPFGRRLHAYFLTGCHYEIIDPFLQRSNSLTHWITLSIRLDRVFRSLPRTAGFNISLYIRCDVRSSSIGHVNDCVNYIVYRVKFKNIE